MAPGWPKPDKFPKVSLLSWEKGPGVLCSQLQREGAEWGHHPSLGAVGVGGDAVLNSIKQAQLELGLDRSLILFKDTFRP